MKSYYSRLTKEEKNKVKEEFLEKADTTVYKKADRIILLGVIGVFIACAAGIFDYLYKTGIYNYIIDGFLFVFSIIFIIKMYSVKTMELNSFALNNKSNKKKKK